MVWPSMLDDCIQSARTEQPKPSTSVVSCGFAPNARRLHSERSCQAVKVLHNQPYVSSTHTHAHALTNPLSPFPPQHKLSEHPHAYYSMPTWKVLLMRGAAYVRSPLLKRVWPAPSRSRTQLTDLT